MAISQVFSRQLKISREASGLSQESLADRANLDRTYVSQLERGLKSPTLTSLEKIADCLKISPEKLIRDTDALNATGSPRVDADYAVRDTDGLTIRREDGEVKIPASSLLSAIDTAHQLIDEIYSIDLDIATILGLRNLSAFFGELMASAVIRTTNGLFRPNPHQDGYPDLLLMDELGKRAWNELRDQLNEKLPFSPFPGGGIEVKATCGAVRSPADCRKRGFQRPALGDTRVACMTGYDWKAHHRETNNLAGILWDFIDQRPRIVALFYSSQLNIEDWSEIVHPRKGGGRTTSLSIMKPSGIRKMYNGWLCVLKTGGYIEFINKKNKGSLISRP